MPDFTDLICDLVKHRGMGDSELERLRRRLFWETWVIAPLVSVAAVVSVVGIIIAVSRYWPS